MFPFSMMLKIRAMGMKLWTHSIHVFQYLYLLGFLNAYLFTAHAMHNAQNHELTIEDNESARLWCERQMLIDLHNWIFFVEE